MAPNTIIDMIKLKSYIENKEKRGNTLDTVNDHENMHSIEAGRNVVIGENSQLRYQKSMQIDKVSNLIQKRKLGLHS